MFAVAICLAANAGAATYYVRPAPEGGRGGIRGPGYVSHCVIANNESDASGAWRGTASCFVNCASDAEITGGVDCVYGALVFAGDYRISLFGRTLVAVLSF